MSFQQWSPTREIGATHTDIPMVDLAETVIDDVGKRLSKYDMANPMSRVKRLHEASLHWQLSDWIGKG